MGSLCDCKMPYGIDYSSRTPWCGTCEISVVSAKFSADWLTVSISFDFQIKIHD